MSGELEKREVRYRYRDTERDQSSSTTASESEGIMTTFRRAVICNYEFPGLRRERRLIEIGC